MPADALAEVPSGVPARVCVLLVVLSVMNGFERELRNNNYNIF